MLFVCMVVLRSGLVTMSTPTNVVPEGGHVVGTVPPATSATLSVDVLQAMLTNLTDTLATRQDDLVDKLTARCSEIECGATQQLSEVEGRLDKRIDDALTLIQNSANSGCSGRTVAVAAEERLKPPVFTDSLEGLHPVEFIAQLSDYFDTLQVPEARRVKSALQCLGGSTKAWGLVWGKRINSMSMFNEKFLASYWGEDKQRKLRFELYNGRFEHGSMTQYFYDVVAKANYLVPAMDEGETVRAVFRHFPPYIERALISARCSDIENSVEVLMKLDDSHRGPLSTRRDGAPPFSQTGNSVPNEARNGGGRGNMTCFTCNQTGHISRECPEGRNGVGNRGEGGGTNSRRDQRAQAPNQSNWRGSGPQQARGVQQAQHGNGYKQSTSRPIRATSLETENASYSDYVDADGGVPPRGEQIQQEN